MKDLNIRKAEIADTPLILKFINELAIYEKAEHEVMSCEADIEKCIFAENSTVEALICELDNEALGFAVYFFNYSTWLGKYGLFLEDLYVSPASRGVGAGKALLKYLAGIAVEKDCGRFEWNVLDWNEPAIKFYQSIGALPQNEWIGYRMEGKAIKELAES
jgi:GNAT superfamily N-acetyltransferase